MEKIIITRNKLIVLCGPQYSGKDTFLRLHGVPENYVVSYDDLRQRIFGYAGLFKGFNTKKDILPMVKYRLDQKVPTILNGMHISKKYYNKFFEWCKELELELVVIACGWDITIDKLIKRKTDEIQKRNLPGLNRTKGLQRPSIPTTAIKETLVGWEKCKKFLLENQDKMTLIKSEDVSEMQIQLIDADRYIEYSKHIYLTSDIHGYGKEFKDMIKFLEKYDPEYILIIAGDLFDRGPDYVTVMKEILHNLRIILIRGNHDEGTIKKLERGTYLKHRWQAQYKALVKEYGIKCVINLIRERMVTDIIIKKDYETYAYVSHAGVPTDCYNGYSAHCPKNILTNNYEIKTLISNRTVKVKQFFGHIGIGYYEKLEDPNFEKWNFPLDGHIWHGGCLLLRDVDGNIIWQSKKVNQELLDMNSEYINYHDHDKYPLRIFCYNKRAFFNRESWDNPIVQKCRGVVVDTQTGKQVSFPFGKIFNVGERPETELSALIKLAETTGFSIYDKLNGHLSQVFFYKGKMINTTKGRICDSEFIDMDKKMLQRLNWDEFTEYYLNKHTFMFESITDKDPHTLYKERIYRKNEMILLAVGNEDYISSDIVILESVSRTLGCNYAKRYNEWCPGNGHTIERFATKHATKYEDIEGWVIVFDNYFRVKIKTSWYLKHRLRYIFTSDLFKNKMIKYSKQNRLFTQEILEEIPEEFHFILEKLQKEFPKWVENKANQYLDIAKAIGEDKEKRKAFALNEKDENCRYFVFEALACGFDTHKIYEKQIGKTSFTKLFIEYTSTVDFSAMDIFKLNEEKKDTDEYSS